MASAQVVATPVNNNSSFQDSNHPGDLFQLRYVTPGFKPFSYLLFRQPRSWKTSHSECLQLFAASCQEPLPLAMCLAMCNSHLFSEATQWSLGRFSSWWKLLFSSDIVSVFQSPLNGKACRAKYRMSRTGLRAKSFFSCSFVMHVVQIANHQYHPFLLRVPWHILH